MTVPKRLLLDTHVVLWWLAERIRDSELPNLPITPDHAMAAGRLPLHHRDPFGRMLIAQAQTEGLVLVTRDKALHEYQVPVLPA